MRSVTAGAAGLWIAFVGAPPSAAADTAGARHPVMVIDGDTVTVGGVRWRLDGIDAPEIRAARCDLERQRGIQAAARLIAALAERGGGYIVPTLTRRGTVANGGFGRRLGRLVLADDTTWADVAVSEGHAVPYAYRREPLPDWCRAGS